MPLALVLTLLAQAPVPKTLAMPGWTGAGVKPEVAALYGDHFAQQLRDGGFKVITAAEIAALLTAERQKQLLGCADDSNACLAELANALGTDATVLVRLVRSDGVFRAHVKVLRSRDSALLAETQLEARSEQALLDELGGAARRLTATLRPPGPRRFAWAPGVLAIAGLGAGIGCLLVANQKYSELQANLHQPSDAMAMTNLGLVSSGTTLQTAGWVALGAGIAAAVVTLALIIFGGGPQ